LISDRGKSFSLHHYVQTSSGAHPASYPVVIGGLSPEVKWQGCEADHSPPPAAEIKNPWSHTSTPPYIFMVWCLGTGYIFMPQYLVKHRDNFTFYLNHQVSTQLPHYQIMFDVMDFVTCPVPTPDCYYSFVLLFSVKVYFENRRKHVNPLHIHNVKLMTFTASGTCSYHAVTFNFEKEGTMWKFTFYSY
jgi:hypothetical protein